MTDHSRHGVGRRAVLTAIRQVSDPIRSLARQTRETREPYLPGVPTSGRGLRPQLVTWPDDAVRREELQAAGIPRLLVLEDGTMPPPMVDDLEDWVWLPTDERDVFARLERLAARQAGAGIDEDALGVSATGVLTVGHHHVKLPLAEAAIMRMLTGPPGRLCPREDLARAAWGEQPRERRSLDSRIFALRRRVAPLGLAIHAVRGRGFVLTTVGAARDGSDA